tara:strand:+ start:446 stop:676 length:231 start_codon:yes stop_codon:yes gene_type:complete
LEEEKKIKKSTFEYCSNDVKTFKQSFNCQQDKLHGSLIENPLGFIIFYVFSVFFIAILFQLSTRKMKIKGKKNKRS